MNDFIELLKKIKIPIVYKNFSVASLKVPYGIYYRKDKSIKADNKVYQKINRFMIEIYYSDLKKQLILESEIDSLLSEFNYSFSKETDITINEEISMTLYSVERI